MGAGVDPCTCVIDILDFPIFVGLSTTASEVFILKFRISFVASRWREKNGVFWQL
jgi:hypothetical protein